MTKREKQEQIISHLQILRTWCAVNPDYGKGLSIDDCHKAVEWLDDALALLKAQEPRVMTLNELLALKENTPVYVESCDGLHGWDVFAGTDYDDGYEYVMTGAPWAAMDNWWLSEYNDTWRCWTSEPTEEQREAVKWG